MSSANAVQLARRLRAPSSGHPHPAALRAAEGLEELLQRAEDAHALLLTTAMEADELAAIAAAIGEWVLTTGQVPLQLAKLHVALQSA